jgi:hypothetical protein
VSHDSRSPPPAAADDEEEDGVAGVAGCDDMAQRLFSPPTHTHFLSVGLQRGVSRPAALQSGSARPNTLDPEAQRLLVRHQGRDDAKYRTDLRIYQPTRPSAAARSVWSSGWRTWGCRRLSSTR